MIAPVKPRGSIHWISTCIRPISYYKQELDIRCRRCLETERLQDAFGMAEEVAIKIKNFIEKHRACPRRAATNILPASP